MTTREAVSLLLVLFGALLLLVAAFALGGIWWGMGTAGGLMIITGALLGIGDAGPGLEVDDELTGRRDAA